MDSHAVDIRLCLACSSSLLALDCALNALRTGACDAAIVGG
jgi:acyl transferase domain-containing protein